MPAGQNSNSRISKTAAKKSMLGKRHRQNGASRVEVVHDKLGLLDCSGAKIPGKAKANNVSNGMNFLALIVDFADYLS